MTFILIFQEARSLCSVFVNWFVPPYPILPQRDWMMSASKKEEKEKETKGSMDAGNPVFTCRKTPAVQDAKTTPWARPQNLLYRTTSGDYGRRPPTAATAPTSYHPRSQKFTKSLGISGMYRNNSFNTAVDRSRVVDAPNLQHTN